MDVFVEIIKVEAKNELTNFELECQAETKLDGFDKKSATINLPEPNSWPKFSYNFKQVSPSAAFLFSIISSELEDFEDDSPPKPIATCLFPFTFSVSASKRLQHLASEISTRSKQTQIAYLTAEVEGSDITKVVGTVWFKVVVPKSIPKLKSKATWMDLNAVIDQLADPEKVPLPSLTELLEIENEQSIPDPFPKDSPTISVVFHSVTTYLKNPILSAAANNSTNEIPREKSLFESADGSNDLYTHSILKSVALKSVSTEGYIELYLANDDLVIFGASHSLHRLKSLKQYHWEYDWRWMAGTGGLPSDQTSGSGEPTVIASVMLTPTAAEYAKFEGLEFLVHGFELDSSVQNAVLSIECSDSDSDNQAPASTQNVTTAPFLKSKGDAADTPSNSCTITVIKDSEATETSSAYFFYPLSKMKGIRLTMKLHAPNKGRLWWQSSKIASASIEIPNTMSSVLSSSENMNGVYWEMQEADISQSDSEKVASEISGVLRWKSAKMKFLSSNICTQMKSLRNFKDLAPVKGIQPGLLTSILSTDLRNELERESKPESIADYKVAVKKMGEDILHLRRQNKILRRDNKQLEEYFLQLENSVIFSTADQAELSALTKADLIHKILEQSQRLLSEISARQTLQNKVKKIQNALIEKNELEAKLMQVQQAHSAQQKLVRSLQLKCEKYRKCSDICKQQEEVIVQLDSLLEKSVQNDKVKEAVAVLSKENARLRKTFNRDHDISSPERNPAQDTVISALRTNVAKLRTKCSDLEAQLEESRRHKSKGLHEQTKMFEANQRVKIASAREKTLIRELEINAKTWAQDKAQYEVQIAEYRAKVSTLEEQLSAYRNRAAVPQLSTRVPNNVAAEQQNRSRAEPTRSSHPPRSRANDPTTYPLSRSSHISRNLLQSQPEEVPRRSLMSISRQLHSNSRNSSIRPHPQSVFENSLDPRLSF